MTFVLFSDFKFSDSKETTSHPTNNNLVPIFCNRVPAIFDFVRATPVSLKQVLFGFLIRNSDSDSNSCFDILVIFLLDLAFLDCKMTGILTIQWQEGNLAGLLLLADEFKVN